MVSPNFHARFPEWVNQHVTLADSSEAFFGTDVLKGLISGIKAATSMPTSRWRGGAALLGSSMWMDDPELMEVMEELTDLCVVITKQTLAKQKKLEFKALVELAERKGLTPGAYAELQGLGPSEENTSQIVGPTDSLWSDNTSRVLAGVREMGFRRAGHQGRPVPIVHAKIALLGHLQWADEHPAGYVMDLVQFVPDRLWVGSANFTNSSRSSLEMGFWTTDIQLMEAARAYLLGLIALSEPLGKGPAKMSPELGVVEYDVEAMGEALCDIADGEELPGTW